MGTLANSVDTRLRLKQPSGTEIHHNIVNFTRDPLKYTMGSPLNLLYQYVWENSSDLC